MQKPQESKGSYYDRMKQFHKSEIDEMVKASLETSTTYVGALHELDQASQEAEQERKQPSEGATFMGLVTKAQSRIKNQALNQNPHLIEALGNEVNSLFNSDDLTKKGYKALIKILNQTR